MTEQPIRLTGPADLAAAIPHLFGYQPTESIVMLCLTGPRRRFACGACTPLPALTGLDVNTEVAALIPTLRSAVRNSHADAVILALITETPDHYTNLALTLATVLHGTATTVQEVISITSTTIGNYRTPTDTQHRNQQHPGADTLAQTNALHGRTVLPHRDDYDHALNPDNGHTITEQQLTDALTDATRTHRTDPAALTTRAEQLYHHAVTLAEHGHTLPDDHTADLTAALTTSLVARDHITTLAIRAATTDQAAATINALTQLAHNTPNPHATPTLTILALTAYRTGNGALANTALNRALTHHPHYPLATLTATLIQAAINPQTLDHLINAQ